MSDTIEKGIEGENLAAEYLSRNGYEIVTRNYRYQKAEIDIIARKENWLLFVEVKTRSSTDFGEPEEFVHHVKASHIFRAAEQFIYNIDWNGHVRFDVISVKLGPRPEIRHFEDAIN